jgi:putative PEP-CTERM system histidine kinase
LSPVFLAFSAAACAAGLILFRLVRPRLVLADVALVVGLGVLVLENLCAGLSVHTADPFDSVVYESWRLVALTLLPGTWLLFSLTFARGQLTRWRILILASLLVPVSIGLLVREGFVSGYYQLVSDQDRRVLTLNWPGFLLQVWLLASSILILMNVERTARAAVGMMHWRIKYMLLGVGVIFVVRLYTSSQALLFRGVDLSLETINAIALILAAPLIAIGIHRGRNQQTDVYPSRSVLQSSVTVLVAGIYLLIVGVFAKIAEWLGGGGGFAVKAFLVLIALISAGVLLQSDNARLRLRQFLSRNFHRPVFDYRQVWRRFTETSATRLEQADLARSMVKLVAQTFDSLSVSLWMVPDFPDTLKLVASTVDTRKPSEIAELPPNALSAALAACTERPDPVNLDATKDAWAAALVALHPRQFPHGGDRWLTPLVGRGEVIGFLLLGDRVGGQPIGLQEMDMLKCVADHISSSLLNIQLSRRLLEAKELEAFQTMATFFVHDLKNAASTLTLMLRNLPVHFDDPEFRQDALRGMGKTVDHINGLISRLSLLRNEMKLVTRPADLNDLVTATVGTLDPATRARCELQLEPLPLLPLDQEQIGKVLTNLLVNAREAMADRPGSIRVTTHATPEMVTLAVEDNGCGMSAEFLRRGLFRPFQTTKKTGLGIGMFQSKMIVEAHGGRITATSEQGHGTIFRIHLPMTKTAATTADV